MNPNDLEQNPESFEQEQYPKQKNVNIRTQSSYPPRSKPRRKASRDSIDSEIQSQQSPYRDFNRAKQHDENRGSLRSVPNTPDRSRAPGQNGAAVPRFGDWENNPGAGEGYTHIFQKVRDDKQVGAPTNGPSHKNTPKLVTSYEDKVVRVLKTSAMTGSSGFYGGSDFARYFGYFRRLFHMYMYGYDTYGSLVITLMVVWLCICTGSFLSTPMYVDV